MSNQIEKQDLQEKYFSKADENTSIVIKSNGKTLFDISYNLPDLGIQFENSNIDLIDILDRAGFYELDMEYIPPTSYRKPSFDTKKSVSEDPKTWLGKVIQSAGAGISYLIPDTNILYRCYYSNFLRDKISPFIGNYGTKRMIIPRLLVLEIENKYNRKTNPEKSKDKRIAFNSMGEIHKMISDGGLFSSKIDYSLLREFSDIAGQGFADSWIRMEISKYHIDDFSNPPKYPSLTQITFFTCDLMNAMAGSAEGLHCVYFYRSERIKKKNLDIAALVYHTSIQFTECNFSIKTPEFEKKYNVRSIWQGKTPSEWKSDSMMINEI